MWGWKRALGYANGNTHETLKKKYHRLLLASHPDKGGSSEEVRRVVEAWEAYSAQRDAGEAPVSPPAPGGRAYARPFVPAGEEPAPRQRAREAARAAAATASAARAAAAPRRAAPPAFSGIRSARARREYDAGTDSYVRPRTPLRPRARG